MSIKRNGDQIRNIVLTLVIIATIGIILISCKKEPEEQAQVKQPQADTTTVEGKPIPPKAPEIPKVKLDDVIRTAKSWDPIFKSYRGMPAPDFTVTDLTGQEHTLSQYKGKNVMIIFWAPWCGPCKAEIPHLIELRKIMPEKELAMLAISFTSSINTPDMIQEFVTQKQTINYPVFSVDAGVLPKPYNLVDLIPSNFFIGPDGKIKLATKGMMPISDIKAVLQAQ